jgi:hypothetical protein
LVENLIEATIQKIKVGLGEDEEDQLIDNLVALSHASLSHGYVDKIRKHIVHNFKRGIENGKKSSDASQAF